MVPRATVNNVPSWTTTRALARGVVLGLLAGCLERVTDKVVPLDPRYYEGHDEGDAEAGNTEGASGGSEPWADSTDARFELTGVLTSAAEGPVQLDLGEPDSSAPGGTKRAGVLQLEGPGPFTLKVPVTVKKLQIQAFQDPDSDGPSEQDPFAQAEIALDGKAPAEPLTLALVAGARSLSGRPTPAPPGAPGGPGQSPGGDPNGRPPSGGDGAPGGGLSTLPPQTPPTVRVTGTLRSARDTTVLVDIFQAGTDAPGGRSYLGRVAVEPGAFTIVVSAALGTIELEAYQDLTGDSRSADDPVARTDPFAVTRDVPGLNLVLP